METDEEWDWTTFMDRFWQGTRGCDCVHEDVSERTSQREDDSPGRQVAGEACWEVF